MPRPIVVDTNILFSALLRKQSPFTETLLASAHRFHVSELTLAELFKHRQKIVKLSLLEESEIDALFYKIARVLEFFKEDLVSPENRKAAYELCKDIDETDSPHVALVLELDGLLWTGDNTLKEGLKKKGFDRFFEP
ncbi:MAG TPA: PIN domain-containing protein [Thermoanaerobaculia bacterium]|nr:PIN domain-containing protein [Thermoanaerobaculia bacterium]